MELEKNMAYGKIISVNSGILVCSVEPHPLCLGAPVLRLVRHEFGFENQAPRILCIPVAESFRDTAAKLHNIDDDFLWLLSGLSADEIYDLLDSDGLKIFGISAELSRSFYFPF